MPPGDFFRRTKIGSLRNAVWPIPRANREYAVKAIDAFDAIESADLGDAVDIDDAVDTLAAGAADDACDVDVAGDAAVPVKPDVPIDPADSVNVKDCCDPDKTDSDNLTGCGLDGGAASFPVVADVPAGPDGMNPSGFNFADIRESIA